MSRNVPPAISSAPVSRLFKRGASLAALGLAVSLVPSAFAQGQAFNTMVGMQAGRVIGPNGQVSQWTGARAPVIGATSDGRPLMSIEQTEQKALLDWEDFRLKTNEVLEFQQQSADWIAVNRVHGNQAAQIDGEIRAIGQVFIFNDNGVLVGKDAQINTRTLVTGKGFSDVSVNGNTTTLVQSQRKGELNWHTLEDGPTGVKNALSVQAGEVLNFEQQAADWFVVNRVNLRRNADNDTLIGSASAQATVINGEVAAKGDVYIFNDAGVAFNADPTADSLNYLHVDNRLKDGSVFLGVESEGEAKNSTRRLVTGKGFSDVIVEGDTTTFVQSLEQGTLDWSNLDLAKGQKLVFRQEDLDWVALNRDYSGDVVTIAGDIKADGNVYLVGRKGLSIDGAIDAQQVVLSSLHMRNDQFEGGQQGGLLSYARDYNARTDPTFSNTWMYAMGPNSGAPDGSPGAVNFSNYHLLMGGGPEISDLNDPLKYNVTIGKSGSVTTGSFGKVILAGPSVINKGEIAVQDEGQVILAAGENIYLRLEGDQNLPTRPGMLAAYVGGYNPLAFMRQNIAYRRPPQTATSQEWADFFSMLLKRDVALNETLTSAEYTSLTANGMVNNVWTPGGLIGQYLNTMQAERARAHGYAARNEGLISSKRGGVVDFRGLNLEQMGSVDMTSTALFRGTISFRPIISDYFEYANGDVGHGPILPGHGNVVFGKGSLTQITPDLESDDKIAANSGSQSVGELLINANSVHMQEDSVIHMPSGKISIGLDAAGHVFNNHRGNGANQGNEDGTRFMMDKGATIDLSGWDVTMEMGYHQVKGKLFAAQLADTPLQKDGPLNRKEISVDRRYGTNVANWGSLDNLSQGTLAQFLTDGGTFDMYVGDDFIMKPGSVIDVSGGVTTYKEGYVYTTLLRRLDGSVIDIREADPDEVYMGLANEWTVYSTKWGQQKNYYIPLMSAARGQWEESYQHGGAAGSISIFAPDAVLQGTVKGEAFSGKYQRATPQKGGSFILNAHGGENEGEYVSDNILIQAHETALEAAFGFRDKLSDVYGDLFGEEFDRATDPVSSDSNHPGYPIGHTTLASADFFNRSTMGSYELAQAGRVTNDLAFPPGDGIAVLVEQGVDLNLQHGASFSISADQRMEFLGSIRTEGGDFSLQAMSLKFAEDSRIDTRGSWYSDYEAPGLPNSPHVPITGTPRVDGGSVSLLVASDQDPQRPSVGDIEFTMPETMVIDMSGGAWVNREGDVVYGKGGDLSVSAVLNPADSLDLSGLQNARAYGLGGNGAFSLGFGDDIVIGHALPEAPEVPEVPEGEEEEPGRPPMLFTPDFFANSGFSAISLTGRNVIVTEGTQVNASAASLVLRNQSLNNGGTPAIWAQSGVSIYDVADIVSLKPEARPESMRKGMDISLSGMFGAQTVTLEEGSRLSTEVGGKISLLGVGGITVDGVIEATAGAIILDAGTSDATGGPIHIGKTAKLLAPGAALITWRGLNSEGVELVDGEIYDGGTISLAGTEVFLAEGSEFDVSGVTTKFDLQIANPTGGVARSPVTLDSNGGSISISAGEMDINNATWNARAGGASASGGSLNIDWQGKFSAGSGQTFDPFSLYNNLNRSTRWYLKGGARMPTARNLWGYDLSLIDWSRAPFYMSTDPGFAPGYTIANRAALEVLLEPYTLLGAPVPPLFVIGDAFAVEVETPVLPDVPAPFVAILEALGTPLPEIDTGNDGPSVTHLATDKINQGGFSNLNLSSGLGFLLNGDVNLGGKKADGSYAFDTITFNAPVIMGAEGSQVNVEAGVVKLRPYLAGGSDTEGYLTALAELGIGAINEGAVIDVKAGTLIDIESARFHGFEDTRLTSGGDIRLKGYTVNPMTRPSGTLHTPGKLTLKADQIYAGTGRDFTISSDEEIEILAQDDGGSINGSPYEAAASLTVRAPRIIQGGTLRSPLGTLTLNAYDDGTEGSGVLTFTPGSLTSVSADGRIMPYGYLSNGDTWLDPFTGLELTTLPTKVLNLTADVVDLQEGSTLDVSGGGDLYAREFVPGVGGTKDWLTGYFDYSDTSAAHDDKWVSTPGEIYAVMPDYEGNIAPLGFGASQIGVGDKVYLAGGSGLPAGYYTLLPSEYALLPGAYRVTAKHRYGDGLDGARLGEVLPLADGSTIQTGYRIDGASSARDQRTVGFHVMSGETLRKRSFYREITANTFFTSEDFLKKALRINRPVADIPRVPLDGGSVVFRVAEELNLGGQLKSQAGKDGRGGFADIASDKVVVAGAGTDLDQYDGYLVLNSDELNVFGAESLLVGGVRKQGLINLELEVTGTDVIIDNAGSVLHGPELLFASRGNIDVKDGAKIETRGQVSGSSGDIRILASTPALMDDNGTSWTPDDDFEAHGAVDQGALLRVSSGKQVDILRDAQGVALAARLRNDPAALAEINALRASKGLDAIDLSQGLLILGDASIASTGSMALDATNDTRIGEAASLSAKQLSAAASRVSIGDTPAGLAGLVFTGNSLGMFSSIQDLTLKSYSTIDLYGGADIASNGALQLDAAEVRVLESDGEAATLKAKTLTLTNTNGGSATSVAGNATLVLEAENIRFEGGDKWLSGIDMLDVKASQRVIGADDSTLHVPGSVSIAAGGITTESGARLFIDAADAINVSALTSANMPVFESFGGTLGLTGSSVAYSGRSRMTGGTLTLQARDGDVVLNDGAVIDVTSNVRQFFDKAVGVGAGSVNLIADLGDVTLGANSLIDVSGSSAGGDAGVLTIRAGLGQADLGGTLKGAAAAGSRSGSFNLLTQSLTNFSAFNATLDAGGFAQSRRFEINAGDVTVDGTVNVNNLAVVANDGSINVTGTVKTTGANGGRIQLSAAENVSLASTAKLLAAANAADGSGGTVLLDTAGSNGGRISTAAGSVIDVSGAGEGGRLVRFRAPVVGNDVAISQLAGTVTGARSVLAEGFQVYKGIETIDQGVIDLVSADATAFMDANGDAIRGRLGSDVTLVAGIELRSDNDMELVDNWDLSGLRFDAAAGVLTLRAKGDLLINANLSDGFGADNGLLTGESWAFNLTAGANTASPDTMAVLPAGLLAEGKGNVVIGGSADTIEYYYDPAYDNEHRLYQLDETGRFIYGPNAGFTELERDTATGQYIDPDTGELIGKDPVTGDYADTARYARRPLPWIVHEESEGSRYKADGSPSYIQYDGMGQPYPNFDPREFGQWNNATGYHVRTGTGAINVAAGRDLVLQERPSVIYTAGLAAAELDGFYTPATPYASVLKPELAQYGVGGGDIIVDVAGSIRASSDTPQLPNGYMRVRGSFDNVTGLFATTADRLRDQTTWWVDYADFQGGLGALGGGNIAIDAGGDVFNLGVAIPNSFRATGNDDLPNGTRSPVTGHYAGGGDLELSAGGNLYGGAFYVADGTADMSIGGSVQAGSQVRTLPRIGDCYSYNDCYIHTDYFAQANTYDLFTLLFTSSGKFNFKSAGDLNIDAVIDPILIPQNRLPGTPILSYSEDARVNLFSAGGDVTMWSNGLNISIAQDSSGYTNLNPSVNPLHFYSTTNRHSGRGHDYIAWDLRPANMSLVAANGDVRMVGGVIMSPAPKGNLEILAGGDVQIGSETQARDPYAFDPDAWNILSQKRSGTGYEGIIMSQSLLEMFHTPTNSLVNGKSNSRLYFVNAGSGPGYPGVTPYTLETLPDLHVGDSEPARIYAAGGDVIIASAAALGSRDAGSAEVRIPKQLWVQAEENIYFPSFTIQHNNPNDVSVVRAGEGIYFNTPSAFQQDQGTLTTDHGRIYISGRGRLEIEAGTDLWLPSTATDWTNKVSGGIVSQRIVVKEKVWASNQSASSVSDMELNPDEKAADIAISVGYNQDPNYAGFEDAYLNPETAAEMKDFLLVETPDGRKLPLYLFDRAYARGNGAKIVPVSEDMAGGFVNYVRGLQGLAPLETAVEQTNYLTAAWDYWLALPASQTTDYDGLVPRTMAGQPTNARPEWYLPESREGLVNYVRRLQGLPALQSQGEQAAYLDTAWDYWQTLSSDYKTPYYRSVLFLELRTTGREANDADNDRYNTTFRGYDAIGTLFPGAQKDDGEALVEGESRWKGDFETYASRVMSFGGGNIDFVMPGGGMTLANAAAPASQTGQPHEGNPRGNALQAGIVSSDGGEVNVFAHDSVILNESRLLTAKGGNVMVWSSWGDIAAGKGAKTSLAPQFYDYQLDSLGRMTREPAGLPTGAGIGTLATQKGAPPADVDLIAPAGVVDAGDAGIRVSGNFNVFAVEILGADNIEVAGIATGLPVPPAAPPTSLDVDVSTRDDVVDDALEKAVAQVQQSNSIISPSLIEVQVTGYDDEICGDENNPCPEVEPQETEDQQTSSLQPLQQTNVVPVQYSTSPEVEFRIPSQMLAHAVREIGQASGFNILYEAEVLTKRVVPAVQGRMTIEQALQELGRNQGFAAVRVGPRTIMLKRQ